MPKLYEEVLKTVHISPTHPMYEKYVNDSVWKYMYGDQKVATLSNYIDVKGLKVLDIGAGIGGLSAAFAKKGAIVTAIDVDNVYENLSRIGYEECGVTVDSQIFDGGLLPFESESYDIVCCFNIFEHVPDLNRLFREMERVLKAGGIVIGRADYKYNWSNIKADPHYGLPLNILMPKWFRRWIVVNVTKRNYELDDIVWAKNFNDISNRFNKVKMSSYRWSDDFISIKIPKSEIIKISGQKENFLFGWYDTETWGNEAVTWSSEKSLININTSSGNKTVSFEIFSVKNKNVWINGIKHFIKSGSWKTINMQVNGIIEFNTKGSKVGKDKRSLGIAIKNLKLIEM